MIPMKQLVTEAVATAIAPYVQEVTVPPCLGSGAAHAPVYLSTYRPKTYLAGYLHTYLHSLLAIICCTRKHIAPIHVITNACLYACTHPPTHPRTHARTHPPSHPSMHPCA